MKKKKVEYIKILIAIIAGFYIAEFSTHEIFVRNTARIRPNLGRYLAQKFTDVTRDVILALNKASEFINPNSPEARLKALPLQVVTKGVYAKSNESASYTLIKINEVEWQEIELKTKSGKVVKLRYPKSQPPTKEMLKIIKGE